MNSGAGELLIASPGRAIENSPRREPWVRCLVGSKPRRGGRIGSSGYEPELVFLSPRRGLFRAAHLPTAHAVGYSLPPLRGFDSAFPQPSLHLAP